MNDRFALEYEPFRMRKVSRLQPARHSCRCSEQHSRTSLESELYQPSSNADATLEGFTGPEHSQIGDRAVGKLQTTIVYDEKGSTLTYGEMIAVAGDYFGHVYELKNLARSPAGREQIRFARWKAVYRKIAKAPAVSDATRKAVVEREYSLAAVNYAHFSAGGYGRHAYSGYHTKAVELAFASGHRSDATLWSEAITFEAFGNHFLTDIFSAGHVRTPRRQIGEWYRQNFGDSLQKFIRFVADFLYRRMDQDKSLKWYEKLVEVLFGEVRSEARQGIERLGGEAIKTFSLGDIVSLAIHDLDNCGLKVVSDLDASGNRIPGGYKWTAVGDSHLNSLGSECVRKPTPRNVDTSKARDMVNSAVKASMNELEQAREAGKRNAGRKLTPTEITQILKTTLRAGVGFGSYAALGYVPREDTTPNANLRLPFNENDLSAPLQWRWGKLGNALYWEVDAAVKGEIAGRLADRIGDVKEHRQRVALAAFVEYLRKDGILVLQRAIGKPAIQPSKAPARTR